MAEVLEAGAVLLAELAAAMRGVDGLSAEQGRDCFYRLIMANVAVIRVLCYLLPRGNSRHRRNIPASGYLLCYPCYLCYG